MERLRKLDGIAYIRFASVYRNFADIEDVRAAADAYDEHVLIYDNTAQLPLFAEKEISPMHNKAAKPLKEAS
jgi:hypothetical protein